MLVVAAGRSAGYIVRTECIVFGRRRSGAPGRGEIDVGWYDCDGDTIRVAWEIDGQDASEEHFLGYEGKDTLGNKAKLLASEAPLKVQVLYSLKNNLRKKGDSKLDCIRRWLGSNVTVVTDEELIRRGGIERWVTAAEAYPHMRDEVVELLSNGLAIVNRYSLLFDANSYPGQIIGQSDYLESTDLSVTCPPPGGLFFQRTQVEPAVEV